MNDPINHPSHYTRFKGIEVIQLTEQLNFCRGNAVKYVARAGSKDPASEIEDLKKAIWYIQREIERIKDDEPEAEKPAFSEWAEEWGEDEDYDDPPKPGEQFSWQKLYEKRAKLNEDHYDYYRAGMYSGHGSVVGINPATSVTYHNIFRPGKSNYRLIPFDEIMFPDKCQECDGSCTVCE